MKHTPGPWKTEVCGTFKHLTRKTGAFSITAGEKLICQFPWARTTGQMVEESEANAHLIAAAPELLEALEDVTKEHEDLVREEFEGTPLLEGRLREIEAAKAIIAKAKGESR